MASEAVGTGSIPVGTTISHPLPIPRIDRNAAPDMRLVVVPRLALLAAVLPLAHPALAQTWEREDVTFEAIDLRAKELAAQPYSAPNKEALPDWMKNLNYDQYRDIRFVPERALWAEGNLPFRAMLFHPGYLFREPVTVNEFTGTHLQRIRLSEAFFNYGPLVGQRGDLPPDAGFAGLRLHAPLNRPDYHDELAVFQGASYWRALGKHQRYGISARGLAIDTGADGNPEEFPQFREFWLRKPAPEDKATMLFALLDGPSCTGAYGFIIQPGDDTVVTVRAALYPRRAVKRSASPRCRACSGSARIHAGASMISARKFTIRTAWRSAWAAASGSGGRSTTTLTGWSSASSRWTAAPASACSSATAASLPTRTAKRPTTSGHRCGSNRPATGGPAKSC